MSLHEYINVSKLFDFSSKKTIDSIYYDLENVYKITNVMKYDDEDALYVICEALYRDYAGLRQQNMFHNRNQNPWLSNPTYT